MNTMLNFANFESAFVGALVIMAAILAACIFCVLVLGLSWLIYRLAGVIARTRPYQLWLDLIRRLEQIWQTAKQKAADSRRTLIAAAVRLANAIPWQKLLANSGLAGVIIIVVFVTPVYFINHFRPETTYQGITGIMAAGALIGLLPAIILVILGLTRKNTKALGALGLALAAEAACSWGAVWLVAFTFMMASD